VRATGTVQPVRYSVAQAPQITGQQSGRLTLAKLVPNGSKVKEGDLLAEFDRTQQLDNAREAQAKFDDLSHQVEQRAAQNRADAARRTADLRKAEADLAKAELQLRKGPLIAEVERLKAEVRAADAREHVASLKKSGAFRDGADAAALRILELQRDRQKVSLERALRNAEKLQVKSPLAGMVAYESVWKGGSMGPPQEGDQLWPGMPLMRIFDPSEMEVRVSVGETDGAALGPGALAEVRLDAYPDISFRAHFDSASPAAASNIGSPIKNFAARFRLERSDPHLLPDLSAAVIIEPAGSGRP
jgi:multidrug resistance efflux pump